MTKPPPHDPSDIEFIEINDDLIEEINPIHTPPLPPTFNKGKNRVSIEDITSAYPKPTFKEFEKLEEDLQKFDNSKLSLSVEKLIKNNVIESDVGNYFRGVISLLQNSSSNSLKYFNNSLESNISFIPSLLEILKIYFKKKSFDKILDLSNKYEIKKNSPHIIILKYLSTIINNLRNSPEDAQKTFEILQDVDPKNPSFIFPSLFFELQNGTLKKALIQVLKLSDLANSSKLKAGLHLYAASIAKNYGDLEKSNNLLRKALDIDSSVSDEVWYQLSQNSFLQQDFKESLKIIKDQCKYLIKNNSFDSLLPQMFELSVLLEGELTKPESAFDFLKLVKSIPNPLLKARIDDLAWHNFNYTWLNENPGDSPEYIHYLSMCKSENIPAFRKIKTKDEILNIQLLFLEHIVTGSADSLVQVTKYFDNNDAKSSLLLLSAIIKLQNGKNPLKILEIYLNNGSISKEGIWISYLCGLLFSNPLFAAKTIETKLDLFNNNEISFLINDLFSLKIALNKDFAYASGLLEYKIEKIEQKPEDLLSLAICKSLSDKSDDAGKYFLSAAKNIKNGEESMLLTLAAARAFSAKGDNFTAEFILHENLFDDTSLKIWELFHRTYSEKPNVEKMVRTLVERGDEKACFELGLILAEDNPAEAADFLSTMDRPESRWLAGNISKELKDTEKFKLLMDVAAQDYKEDKFLILAKTGFDLENIFNEESLDYYLRSYNVSPQDSVVFHLFEYRCETNDTIEDLMDFTPPLLSRWEWFELSYKRGWILEKNITTHKDFSNGKVHYDYLDNQLQRLVAIREGNFAKWHNTLKLEDKNYNFPRYELNSLIDEGDSTPLNARVNITNPDIFSICFPFRTPIKKLNSLFPTLEDSYGLKSLASLGMEQDGRFPEASNLRTTDEENILPTTLSWLRQAKVYGDNSLIIRQSAMVADSLPRNSKPRKEILELLATYSKLQGYNELSIQALHTLWGDFNSHESLKQALFQSLDLESENLAIILWEKAVSILTESEKNSVFIKKPHFSTLPPLPPDFDIPSTLNLEMPLTPVDFTPPAFSPTGNCVTDELLLHDAVILQELGITHEKPEWIIEACRLFLAGGSYVDGSRLLYSLETDSLEKQILCVSTSLHLKDFSSVYDSATALGKEGVKIYAALALELSLLLDEKADDKLHSLLKELSIQINIDKAAKDRDIKSLINEIEKIESIDNPIKIIAARMYEDIDFEKSLNLYQKMEESLFSSYIYYRQYTINKKQKKDELIFENLKKLYDTATVPWIELEFTNFDYLPENHSNHPLVLWAASDKNLASYSALLDFIVSKGLKARFSMNYLIKNDTPIETDTVELDPKSYEWESLWKLRCNSLNIEDRKEYLSTWAQNSKDPLMRWWFNSLTDQDIESISPIQPLIIIDRLVKKRFEVSLGLSSKQLNQLPSSFRTAVIKLLLLTGVENPYDFIDIKSLASTIRLMALLKGETENLIHLLNNEDPDSFSPSFINYLRMHITKGEFKFPEESIASIYYEEQLQNYTSCWEPFLTELSPENASLLALRNALMDEYFSREKSDIFLDLSPAPIKNRINYRWERRFGNIEEIIDSFEKCDFKDEPKKFLLAIFKWINKDKSTSIFKGFSDPIVSELSEIFMLRNEMYKDLETLLKKKLNAQKDKPHQKTLSQLAWLYEDCLINSKTSHSYRKLMLKNNPTDYFSFFRIIENNILAGNKRYITPLFNEILDKIEDERDKAIFRLEIFRRNFEERKALPNPADTLSGILNVEDNITSTWWNFVSSKDSNSFLNINNILPESESFKNILLGTLSLFYENESNTEKVDEIYNSIDFSINSLNIWLIPALKHSFSNKKGSFTFNLINILSQQPGIVKIALPDHTLDDLKFVEGQALEKFDPSNDKIAQYYLELLKNDISNDSVFGNLMSILKTRPDPEIYEEILKLRIQINDIKIPRKLRYLKDIIEFYINREDTEKAIKYLNIFLNDAPENIWGLERIASIFENTEQYENAMVFLSRMTNIVTEKPKKAALFERLGFCIENINSTGSKNKALKNYTKAVSLDNKLIFSWSHIATITESLKLYEKSEFALKKAITLSKNDISENCKYHIRLAFLYENHLENLKNAENHFEQASSLDPVNMENLGKYINFMVRHGKISKRKITLDRLIGLEQDSIEKNHSLRSSFKKIAWYLFFKQDPYSAGVMSDISISLGVSETELPVPPLQFKADHNIFPLKELGRFPLDVNIPNSLLNLFSLIKPNSKEIVKYILQDMTPPSFNNDALSSVLKQLNINLDIRTWEEDRMIILPGDPDIILVPPFLRNFNDLFGWEFLIQSELALLNRGLTLPQFLSIKQSMLLISTILNIVGNDAKILSLDSQQVKSWMTISKIALRKIDKNRLQGIAIEMGSINEKILSSFKTSIERSGFRFGLISSGSFKSCITGLDQLKNDILLKELTTFAVSKQYLTFLNNYLAKTQSKILNSN